MHSLTVHFPPTRQDSTVCILGPLDLQIKHNVSFVVRTYVTWDKLSQTWDLYLTTVVLRSHCGGGGKSHKVPIST